jgi:hypothetical protein
LNARNCALLATNADTEFNRLKLLTMRDGWLALAEAEEWLAGHELPETASRVPLREAAIAHQL